MARLACSFEVSVAIDELPPLLVALLEDLEFDVQYHTDEYIMAREVPGNVSFIDLARVEVLIDKLTAVTESKSRFNIIFQNENPRLEDGFQQLFNFVKQAIEGSSHWHLLGSFSG